MNSKKFEYQHKDIIGLKRDILFRSLFMILFLGVFVWQFIMMFTTKLTVANSLVSASVLVTSLMLMSLSLMYIFKNFRIISAIKINGKCVSSVQVLIKTDKKSFIKLYCLLTQFLTLATTLILISSLTYTILQATYLSTVSFYMPLLMLVCVSGYNSIYHIKDEIKTQKTVQQYNATY